jgi:hypothetical protein
MQRARMPALRAVGSVIAVGWAVAAALPVGAAVKLTRGQELIYSGTGEWKMVNAAGPSQTFSGPVQLSAVITETDAAKGHAVILMRSFQPKAQAGQPSPPSEVGVGTVRYGADLTVTPAQALPGGPLGAILQTLSAPLTPQVELKSGQEWRRKEMLPAMPPPPVEVVYTVAGETKVGDRAGLKIEKKLAQALPYKQPVGGGTLELIDYGQTITVDPTTGVVLSDQVRGSGRFTAGDQKVTLDYGVTVNLTETRQLSDADLAARVKQAAAIDQVQSAIFSGGPGSDRKQMLADATRSIAAFRKEHASSPYTPALARLEEIVGQIRSQADRETRSESLKGKPAPAIALKDLAGKEQTLGAYRGKIILLNFFASW